MPRNSLSFLVVLAALAGCAGPSSTPVELRRFPVFSLDDVVSRELVELDADVTQDHNGAIRCRPDKAVNAVLFDVGDLDVAGSRLLCRAWLRAEGLEGKAFLQLVCHYPGRENVVTAMPPLEAATEWTRREIAVDIKAGEKPDDIRLELVLTGKGTVWVDDVSFLRAPRP